MYLVGRAHPNRERAASLLRQQVAEQTRLMTSSEVYQEILHRYRGLERLAGADDAFALLDDLVDEVASVELSDVRSARQILSDVPTVSSRDALHAAVMHREGVERILTFDGGFDDIPWIDRIA